MRGQIRWVLVCLLLAPASARAQGGPLVLVGGSLESSRIFGEIVRLSGGKGRARIGVITAASGRARDNASYYEGVLRRHGAADVQWIAIGERPTRENLAQIRNMTGFFFGGGDQSRLLKKMLRSDGTDSAELRAIRAAMAKGAMVGGTSAGTAAQVSGAMITGGESYDALRRRPQDALSPRRGGQLSYHSGGGLGLFKWGALDTHFNERGRSGRLIRLAQATGQPLAFGVDENTALVVKNPLGKDPQMTVVGNGGVSVFDLTSATAGTSPEFWIKNVRAAYLTEGDTYRPRRRKMRRGSGKQPVSAREGPRIASNDVFSSRDLDRRNAREFVRVTTGIFSDPRPTVTTRVHEDPSWQVTISKTHQARCYRPAGGSGGPRCYKNLRLDIRRAVSQRVRSSGDERGEHVR